MEAATAVVGWAAVTVAAVRAAAVGVVARVVENERAMAAVVERVAEDGAGLTGAGMGGAALGGGGLGGWGLGGQVLVGLAVPLEVSTLARPESLWTSLVGLPSLWLV